MGGALDSIANQRLTLAFGATSSIKGAERVMIDASPTRYLSLDVCLFYAPFESTVVTCPYCADI